MSHPKVILTHGRAGRVVTLKWLPCAKLCVAESQAPLYAQAYPGVEQIVHPDTVVGLLPKRNWLYENVGSAFQLADDIKGMTSVWQPRGERQIHATGELAEAVIDRLMDECEQLGAYLCGFSPLAHPLAYDPGKPYRLKGLVYGQAFGLLAGSKLFWSPKVKIAGDYWLSLLNAYHHRICLVDNRWSMVTVQMFTQRGGVAGTRTVAAERADNELFWATFGRDVIRLKRQGKGPVAATTPLKFEGSRTIRLPF